MLLMVDVEDDARTACSAGKRVGAGDGSERIDAGILARADPRRRAVGAAQSRQIGLLALGSADAHRILQGAERMGGGGSDRRLEIVLARREFRCGKVAFGSARSLPDVLLLGESGRGEEQGGEGRRKE